MDYFNEEEPDESYSDNDSGTDDDEPEILQIFMRYSMKHI